MGGLFHKIALMKIQYTKAHNGAAQGDKADVAEGLGNYLKRVGAAVEPEVREPSTKEPVKTGKVEPDTNPEPEKVEVKPDTEKVIASHIPKKHIRK